MGHHGPGGRTMTVLDVMALVGSAAVGLVVFRFVIAILGVDLITGLLRAQDSPAGFIDQCLRVLSHGAPLAGAWIFVAPLVRLRRPRPSLRELARRPGIAASLGAAFGLGFAALGLAITQVIRQAFGRPMASLEDFLPIYVAHASILSGAGVAGVWLGLALGGLWRPAEDWADRLGRAAGLFWVVFGLGYMAQRYLLQY